MTGKPAGKDGVAKCVETWRGLPPNGSVLEVNAYLQKMSDHRTYLNYSLKDLEEDRKAIP